jgi:glyoxylase-like metal-dependent hydrolase (beta-lactamase superfamily II)
MEPTTPLAPVKRFVADNGVRIYRIPCQVFEALSARVYLLLGAGVPTLLDTGSGQGASTIHILAGIEAVRREFREEVRAADLGRILISHGHPDHIGGLPELVRLTGAEVAVHALDRSAVVSQREYVAVGNSRLNEFLTQAGVDPGRRADLLALSHYRGAPIEGVTVGRTLADGDEIDGLRVIHTPGHSPGHVCIGVGDILLSADHILSQTVPQQWPESTGAYTGLGHYLESLDKIAQMPGFTLTLAAHEQAIHDLPARIETIRAAHARRLNRLLDMLGKASRPLSLDEIAHRLYPDVTGFRALLAITDVGARVEYLHQRGRLVVANFDDVECHETRAFRYRVA